MPAYCIEKLENLPAILITLTDSWNFKRHLGDFITGWREALEAEGERVTCIIDTHTPPLPEPDFNDIIRGANEGARGANAIGRHPLIREIYVVSTNPALSLAAQGLRAEVYGRVRIRVFNTVEEALAQLQR